MRIIVYVNFKIMLVHLRVQVAKIQAASGDNLFDRLAKNQSISRVILKHSVPLMVSRLGPRFPSASLRGLLFPIVQTVVVEHQIAKISSHEDYAELRTASPDGEFALLQIQCRSDSASSENLQARPRIPPRCNK